MEWWSVRGVHLQTTGPELAEDYHKSINLVSEFLQVSVHV